MAHKAYQVTENFEEIVAKYTGAKYAVAVDNCSNALFLSLKYEAIQKYASLPEITIPARTYVSVPCSIIHAGYKVKFANEDARGAYQLHPTRVYDAALRFRKDMYIPDTLMCLSFSGPTKILKLGKGGMILTDDEKAYEWLKLARFSGRHEVSHQTDSFAMIGWNFYMLPEIAARGLVLMMGMPDYNEDVKVEYQDLSKYLMYTEDK